jgi:hypothetical protein
MQLSAKKFRQQISATRAIGAAVLFLSGYVAGEGGAFPSFAAGRVRSGDKAANRIAAAGDEKTSAPGGVHEGIKVHGHWTVVVRNPDGSLGAQREFENALYVDGPLSLATSLGRSATVGLWFLSVGFADFNSGPCLKNSAPFFCVLTESADTIDRNQPNADFYFPTLTVNAPFQPDPNAGTLTLAGTFTVQNAGPIGSVASAVGACAPNVAPASCILPPGSGYQVLGQQSFTVAHLTTPLNVTVGQVVQVTVVFSFS